MKIRGPFLLLLRLHELANFGVGLFQNWLLRQKHDSEMLGARLLTEAGALNDENVPFNQQLLHECCVILRNINFREGIERAAGWHAAHPWDGIAGRPNIRRRRQQRLE